MQECWHRCYNSSHFESTNTSEYICSHTCASVRRTAVLREFVVPSGPLLHQCRGKRAIQTEDQTEEPQHVDPDGGCCGSECLTYQRCIDRETCPVRNVEKLSRYLSKERIGGVAGIGG